MDWIFKHFKFFVMLITTIIIPPTLMIFSFILEAKQTTAQVYENTSTISKIGEIVYRQDGQFRAVMDSLQRIENRNYEELRAAKAAREKLKE